MKVIINVLATMALVFALSSCGSETCQTCTVVQVITQDGEEVGRQTVNSNQEYCGDALDAIKATEQTVTQEVGGFTQEATTTVDCN